MKIDRGHLCEHDLGRLHTFAETVATIAIASRQDHDRAHVVSSVLDHITQVIAVASAAITLIENNSLQVHAVYGDGLNRVRGQLLSNNNEPIWHVLATGETHIGRNEVDESQLNIEHARIYLAVPLRWNGLVQGVIELGTRPPCEFDETDVTLATSAATMLSGQIAHVDHVRLLNAEIARRERAVGRIAAQYTVTRILSEASSFMDVAEAILQTIGDHLRWETGLMWCVQGDTNMLQCTATWAGCNTRASEFLAASRDLRLPRGAGLPGRVWAYGEPQWVSDVLTDQQFQRSHAAAQADLHTAYAFPIAGSNTFFGVIEFFSEAIQTPDTELLQTTAALGRQMGQFIERKRAQQAQRESEQYTGSMLETALDAIIAIDHTGRITEWNPAAEHLFGYCRTKVLGKQLDRLIIPPALREQHRTGMAEYLATGIAKVLGRRLELSAMRADGTEFPIELSITRVPGGGTPRFTGYVRDITERKQAEAAIHFQAHLLNMVEQAVIATDITGSITFWNRFAEKLYGWTADEVLGRNISEVTPAPESQAQVADIMAHLRAGESWVSEFMVQRRDGTRFPALVIDSPVFDAQSKVIGIVGVSHDISAAKRAERAQRFLVEAGDVLSASLDYHTTLQQIANLAVPELADWCAVELHEADGSTRRAAVAHRRPTKGELAHEVQQQYPRDVHIAQAVARVMRTGESELVSTITNEHLVRAAHNAEHLALFEAIGLTSAMIIPLKVRGQVVGTISFVTAESGRHYDEADLSLAQNLASRSAMAIDNATLYQKAQAAITLRDEFLSIASHELKTPLTTMLGHSQALQRRIARQQSFGERDQRALQIIIDQILRLNKQIGTLLDVSRIELGQFRIEQAPVNLAGLVAHAVAELEQTLEQHMLSFSCGDDTVMIDGDARLLEHVLQNLLGNAVKYSPNGGTISVHLTRDAREACFSVRDEGIGIPESAQPYLFQRFYRASNVSGHHISGLGIGLYLVNEIVAQHGGTIAVASTEGAGSTFTVRIPLA